MVIFQYNLYIFGIHLWTVLYPKPCYNEPCYKEVVMYLLELPLYDTSNEYYTVFMEIDNESTSKVILPLPLI